MTNTTMQPFYIELTGAINAQIAAVYGVAIMLLTAPAQGEFLWTYQAPGGGFNAGTFDFLSATVSPAEGGSVAQLSTSGGFPNAFVLTAANLFYRLSSTDRAAIARSNNAAAAEGVAAVRDYESAFGTVTSADLSAAQRICGATVIQTSIDYVLTYVLGHLWSGTDASGKPPLTYDAMAAAGSLDAFAALLPATPQSGAPVVKDAWAYLSATVKVVSIEGAAQFATWCVTQSLTNAMQPSAANGGMMLIDPNSGTTSPSFQVGYEVGVPVAAIASALSDTSQVINVTIAATPTTSGNALVSINDGSPLVLATTDLATFTPAGGAAVSLIDSAPASISIQYSGYTLVPAMPVAFDFDHVTGWFLPLPIGEAVANGSSDITGYAFVSTPPVGLQSFADGGTFATLSSLLISNQPTVTFQYPQPGGVPPFAGVSGTLRLCGNVIALQCTAGLTRSTDGDASVLAFLPATEETSLLARTATPIGCTFINPGVAPAAPQT